MPDYQKGLEMLLDLHGTEVHRDDGYTWRIHAWQVPQTKEIPHGIRYSLTLHDQYNTRVLGYDNAHAVKPPKRGRVTGKRVVYDHLHRTPHDKGVPYEFDSPAQLLEDFFTKVDEVIHEREQQR